LKQKLTNISITSETRKNSKSSETVLFSYGTSQINSFLDKVADFRHTLESVEDAM